MQIELLKYKWFGKRKHIKAGRKQRELVESDDRYNNYVTCIQNKTSNDASLTSKNYVTVTRSV